MKIEEYRKLTIIMRNLSNEQAYKIATVSEKFAEKLVIEVTLNSPQALEQIKMLCKNCNSTLKIGAGTVRSLNDIKLAKEAGAQFVLGPHKFTKKMLDYCREEELISVPSAMTPSEVDEMFNLGADIVKIFPASVVGPRFFKDVQGPFGELQLMAVGGVNKENVKSFIEHGAEYVGIGSSMFSLDVLEELEEEKIEASIVSMIDKIYKEE